MHIYYNIQYVALLDTFLWYYFFNGTHLRKIIHWLDFFLWCLRFFFPFEIRCIVATDIFSAVGDEGRPPEAVLVVKLFVTSYFLDLDQHRCRRDFVEEWKLRSNSSLRCTVSPPQQPYPFAQFFINPSVVAAAWWQFLIFLEFVWNVL